MQIVKATARQLICTTLMVCIPFVSSAQKSPAREHQIKAVFLFNFAQFIEWPSEAFAHADTPMIIGILGQDPFGGYLDETVKNEKINGHPLIVERYRSVNEASSCHILFINISKTEQLKSALAGVKAKNILTVGDSENFVKQGGMIRFFTESSKTRIQINLKAVKQADLTISSKLLRVAEIVTP
ncbi:MAG: YfiR family protein [Bacteroidota bacterium]